MVGTFKKNTLKMGTTGFTEMLVHTSMCWTPSTLKIETGDTSGTLALIYEITLCYIPENGNDIIVY
jgi:hypothetical protein